MSSGEIPVSSSPRYPMTDVSSANAPFSTSLQRRHRGEQLGYRRGVEAGLDRGRDAPGAVRVPERIEQQVLIALRDADDAREPVRDLELTQQRLDASQGDYCTGHRRILADAPGLDRAASHAFRRGAGRARRGLAEDGAIAAFSRATVRSRR